MKTPRFFLMARRLLISLSLGYASAHAGPIAKITPIPPGQCAAIMASVSPEVHLTGVERVRALIEEHRGIWTCGAFESRLVINRTARLWDEHFGVRSLSSRARARRTLKVKNGRLYLGGARRPLNTTYFEAIRRFGPKYIYSADDWMYVMLNDGRILLSPNGLVDIKHSSLAPHGIVAASGLIRVVGGRLVYLDNGSGHYLPGIEALAQVLFQLECLGADTSELTVKIH